MEDRETTTMASNSETTRPSPSDVNNQDSEITPTLETEKREENNKDVQNDTAQTSPEDQYISGMRLYALISSIALCFVLVTLDMSIIATVCLLLS